MLRRHWLGSKYMKMWKISMSSLVRLQRVEMKKIYGKRDLSSLIFHIGIILMWDTVLMSCMWRKMYVIVLLAHFSTYKVVLRMVWRQDWICKQWEYVKIYIQGHMVTELIVPQLLILCRRMRKEVFASVYMAQKFPQGILQILRSLCWWKTWNYYAKSLMIVMS